MTTENPSGINEVVKKNGLRILLIVLALLLAAAVTFFSFKPELLSRFANSANNLLSLDRPAAAAGFAEKKQAQSEPSPQSAPSASSAQSAVSSSCAPAPSSASAAKAAVSSASTVTLAQATAPLSVKVSIKDQKVTVLDAKNRTVKTFACSSGKSGSDTPTGTFTVSDRGKSFYNPRLNAGAYYWTRFYREYLFHSVPFDKHYNMEAAEAAKLGTPASHGCIRLSVEDAKWIYDHIPEGTKVVIY